MPDDPSILPKLLVLIVLILVNAFFAAAEIAVISLSETKLKKQAEEGDKKAKKLLALTQAPDHFLSAIQIAITLAGFLSSAFAADSFSGPLVNWLVARGVTQIPAGTLNTITVIIITIILSYFSLVLGELGSLLADGADAAVTLRYLQGDALPDVLAKEVPRALSIVSPDPAVTLYSENVYLIGTSDPEQPLTVNGQN